MNHHTISLLLNIDIYLKMLRKWIVSSVSLSIGINLRRWEVNLVNSYIYSLITNYIIIYIHTHIYILIPIKINSDTFCRQNFNNKKNYANYNFIILHPIVLHCSFIRNNFAVFITKRTIWIFTHCVSQL